MPPGSAAGPEQLYRAGKLDEAIRVLSEEIRSNPGDARRRTFLFELLCFAGQFDRARKHLEALPSAGPAGQNGAMLYGAAMAAERARQELFKSGSFPASEEAGEGVRGTLNGNPFEYLSDADPRIGARLEVIAGNQYLWIPLRFVASIVMEPPKRLRDLMWAPAVVETSPAFQGRDLGEVLLPVLSPFSWRHADEAVRLGRMTVWEDGDIPYGQKLLLVGDEALPLLELRELEIQS